jgi:hypothetical protein
MHISTQIKLKQMTIKPLVWCCIFRCLPADCAKCTNTTLSKNRNDDLIDFANVNTHRRINPKNK